MLVDIAIADAGILCYEFTIANAYKRLLCPDSPSSQLGVAWAVEGAERLDLDLYSLKSILKIPIKGRMKSNG